METDGLHLLQPHNWFVIVVSNSDGTDLFTSDDAGGAGVGGGTASTGTGNTSATQTNLENMAEFVEFKINKLITQLELDANQVSWISNDNNIQKALDVYDYVSIKRWSPEAIVFSKLAIEAWVNGGEVDINREIIIDSTIPPCVNAIINQLITDDTIIDLGDMPDFVKQELNLSGFILNIFNNSENFKLIFNSRDLTTITPSGTTYKNAQTDPQADPNNPGKFIFTITIDQSYISNSTDLTIARTIIHETVHAYISYFYQNTPFSSLSFSLRHLLSLEGATDQTAQHMLMTTNFVSAISNSLANWDNNSISINNYYDYLSWSGAMLNTTTFNNMSTTFQQNTINANIAEGQAGPNGGYDTSNAKGTKNCN